MNAGWYHKGFRPGEAGNAVIAGHLDSSTGGPAVFWSLNQLAPGDEVFVTYSSGLRLQFQVEGNQVYDHDAEGPTIDTIFGSSQTADLNLITCKGAWDYGNATYSERLVVFTHLVGEAPVDTVSQ
ncbi:MAG: class F sortase [Ardenticatenia bacterium]|nr:class F sortase [Ardenticatenia bacterium]